MSAKPLFYKFGANIVTCFKGKYLVAQIVAVLLSIAIVKSDFDWTYYLASRNPTLRTLIFPAITLGGLLPIILPLGILAWGKLKQRADLVWSAWGLGQAAMLGLFISSFYKAFTGRIPPHFRGETLLVDMSHGFQFGFLRGGVFWGWPSSHTTVAVSLATAFYLLFPKQQVLRALMLLFACYVAFGVSVSIHWLSEAVAGLLVGAVVGIVVGKSFMHRVEQTPEGEGV